jgi:oligopeptide transport system permease protein
MLKYVLKRIFSAFLAVIILITATFFLMHMVPGSPFLSERMTDTVKANLEKKYGLDKPLTTQYAIYLKNLVEGDMGTSLQKKGRTVTGIIEEKFPYSAKLGLFAIVLAVCIGIPLGAIAAIKHDKLIDRLVMLFTTVFISVPGFVFGTLLLVIFCAVLKIAPATWSNTPANYVLPVISLSFYPICYITKLTRSSMLETLGQDYIKTAHAKGLSAFVVNFKHALKNSIIPVISYVGPLTAFLITGTFAVEKLFSVPGLGRFFVDSVSNRDYPVIMGTTIFLGCVMVLMNLIVDFIYGMVDPRIKLR